MYDLFQIDAPYILDHLREQHPDIPVEEGGAFRHVFEHNTNAFKDMIDLRPGDVMAAGYKDDEGIEVLGVDLCKALPVTDFVVREFFPRLTPGALVMQQDFIHEFHPHIHLSMLLLADHFEKFVEPEWGGSVAYRCIRPITPDTIVSRFGRDLAWYSDVPSNARLLRNLADQMVFGGNAWVIWLTLGWYYYQNGCLAEAQAAYCEARERYPDFEPHPDTTTALGGGWSPPEVEVEVEVEAEVEAEAESLPSDPA